MGKVVRVRICVGTSCYLLGGASLLELEHSLPEEVKNLIEIEVCPCLGLCKDALQGRPPFVIVGEKLIVEADMSKVIEEIVRQIRN